MKKIMFILFIALGVLGLSTSVLANTRTNDPIRDILRVDYTISTTEIYKPLWAWYEGEVVRWQMVEVHQPLDMRRFARNDYYPFAPFGGLWKTQTGDVKIATYHGGQQYLVIDVGLCPNAEYDWVRAYFAVLINVELNPVESINYNEKNPWSHIPKPCFIQFGMYHEYITENFIFRSNEENVKWLPKFAAGVESYWDLLMQVFPKPEEKLIVYFFDIDDMVEASIIYPNFLRELGEIVEQSNGQVAAGNGHWKTHGIAVQANPRGFTDVYDFVIATAVHEVVHVLQYDVTAWHRLPANWIHEGAASFLGGNINHFLYLLHEAVRNNEIPTLDNMEAPGVSAWDHPNLNLYGVASVSVFQFITDVFGMDFILPFHRYPDDYQSVFGISRDEFERQWHRWLRNTIGDPSVFYPDPAIIGTWDKLATQQSLDSFTQRNQRNVNNWAQDILLRRGNSRQQLTFNDNGRISATGVTGFGNRWTDGSIGGRGYEIRTIGDNDYLFVNSQSLGSPSAGMGAPWTVFVRR
ncbi:MAG: hypothetical protein FWE90_10015 [Defluviitaleaceae bacterium]|nr:hypothetical protein [Defluviitaleaceae bacterium]